MCAPKSQKNNKIEEDPTKSSDGPIFDQFIPFLFKQFETSELLTFDTFNQAVDEYFSKIESQKADQKIKEHETTVERKVEKVNSFSKRNKFHFNA